MYLHFLLQQLESEVYGHNIVINKIYARSDELISHCKNKESIAEIEQVVAVLRHEWQNLKDLCTKRKMLLEISKRKRQYLSEAADFENWLNEKSQFLDSNLLVSVEQDDEASTEKLISKHKTFQVKYCLTR